MSLRLCLVLLLLPACAGPSAHRAAVQGSALDPKQEEAKRVPVADILSSPDPLGEPAKEEEPAKAQPHEHHHESSVSAPEPEQELPDAKVVDPMCKMKLDPKTAGGGSLTFEGRQHFFCSSACRRNFLTQHPGANGGAK